MRELSAKTSIDQAILSKYELGKRIPTAQDVKKLSEALEIDFEMLNKEVLAQKVINLIQYEVNASEILAVAESRIEYLTAKNVHADTKIGEEILKKLETCDRLKNEWLANKPLNRLQLEKLEEYFRIKYTYDSNKIEGNTLTYQETSLVVNQGITIGGKSMKDHLEAINHADAIHFIHGLVDGKEEISKRTLLEVHQLILKSIDQHYAGKYRDVPVMISGSDHKPPEPFILDKLMEEYFTYYQVQKKRMHPILLAAEMHERLVSIHPFIDGNGRTSRLVMNFILLKNGFTITSLKGDLDDRLTYYKSLEEVQLNNNPEVFYHLIVDQVINSLEEHLSLV